MIPLAGKILFMFLLTIAVIRLMGKSAIVQLTPYDLVAIVIIGTVAAEPLISTEMGSSVATLCFLTLFYLLFAKLTLHPVGNRLLLGKPTILIKHGQVIEDHLEKSHLSMAQLLAILRASGYPDLTKIDYAILEPIGAISIIPKPEASPLSAGDIGLSLPYEGLPIAVVIDGRIQRDNLKLIHRDEKWVKQRLEEHGIRDLRKVIYAFAKERSEDLMFNLREPGPQKEEDR